MKANVKKLKDCKVRLTVEVEPELVENRFSEVLRDIQRAARIPGFREGKAPLDIIEKKFSKEAHEEVLKTLIPEAYHRTIAEQKLAPVELPSISDIEMQRGKSLKFSAEFEKEPEFNLKNYKGIKVKKSSIEVTPEDLQKGMDSLLESRAELMPVERAVQKGDFVVSDIEIWQDGEYKPNRKGVLLSVEPNKTDDFYDKVLGAQVDEVREVTVEGKPMYKIWIRTVKEKRLPELNDEFAKSFGKDTVEDLKEAARKDIARHKQSESYEAMKAQVFQALLGLVTFPLPEGLVEKQKEKLLEQAKRQYRQMGMPQEKLEESIEKVKSEAESKAKEQVKLYFILKKVSELEHIEAEEDDIERRLIALAEESKRPVDEVRRVFEEDIRESMTETKTIDFLVANAKLEETKEEGKK